MHKVTCHDLLLNAVEKGSIVLAHVIYLGIQHGYFQSTDSADVINFEKIPREWLMQAVRQNVLRIKEKKLFAVRRPYNDEYAYYVSHTEKDAVKKHWELFHEHPVKVFEQTHKIHISIISENEPIRKAKSFYEYARGRSLPVFICLMNAKKIINRDLKMSLN